MDEMMKKYEELEAKAKTIKGVGQKIADLIEQNNASIIWYNKRIEEDLEKNPDSDTSWYRGCIEALEEENVMIAEIEKMFWKTHAF